MYNFLKLVFGDPTKKLLNELDIDVKKINSLESEFEKMTDEQLRDKTNEFRARKKEGKTIDDFMHEAFCVVREASKRTLKQRHFDVQLIGGMVLHRGQIAEMRTGEGKTLTSTLAAYSNALEGKGVHIVTPNDYLAKRDAIWMGQIFHKLGLSVAVIQQQHEQYIFDPNFVIHSESDEEKAETTASFKIETSYARPCSRQEAYLADITYGTNNEFGFDYLRDNMVMEKKEMVQRGLHYAIVDEIDSILIDEARTPLIISAPAEEGTQEYYNYAKIIRALQENEHYTTDEKQKTAILTSEGIEQVEKALGISNLYTEAGIRTIHHIENALKAFAMYRRDKDYVVQNDEIIIVDEFTGRLMIGRRYSEGLHQAIEAKEGVEIQRESETLATITFQNYFRMYEKLAGMTGTAATEAEEFMKTYGLDVVSIPTNMPVIRTDLHDKIYANEKAKFRAVIKDIKERTQKGQPILVGTASIEKNELLSEMLEKSEVEFEMLNAKNHEREAQIIAQAGRPGKVTVATNMAGRGVDIVFGGNPPNKEEAEIVRNAGGLCVIGTERHESRRIDNQLRGRSGRQGDPGESQFYLSVEDELMRVFGSDRMKSMMEKLHFPEDTPIQNVIVSKSIETAQKKVESHNFDIRKHLLEYDDVLNRHRTAVYNKRREILELANSDNQEDWKKIDDIAYRTIEKEFARIVDSHFTNEKNELDANALISQMIAIMPLPQDINEQISNLKTDSIDPDVQKNAKNSVIEILCSIAKQQFQFIQSKIADEREVAQIEKNAMLRAIDMLWVEHLVAIQYLRNSIGLQGYGQRDPLIEYKKITFTMYNDLMSAIDNEIVATLFRIGHATIEAKSLMDRVGLTMAGAQKIMGGMVATESQKRGEKIEKLGRNEPCSCGSGKKFKKCHGA